MKIVKLSIIILGFLISPSLTYAVDFQKIPEAREFFESLEIASKTEFGWNARAFLNDLSDSQDLAEKHDKWGNFINSFYSPTLKEHPKQTGLFNRFLHTELIRQGLGPWFLQNIVSSVSDEGFKGSIKKDIFFSLSFDAPVGSRANNEFMKYASEESPEYFDVWKRAFQKIFSVAPQAIQLNQESIQSWRDVGVKVG